MIRLSRLSDYGVVLMGHIASDRKSVHNALGLAAATGLPAPTVSKILSALARDGLLDSFRGAKGGYKLARGPEDITVAEVVSSVDGPIALTECIEDVPGDCNYQAYCPARRNWQLINDAVRRALGEITLAALAEPFPAFLETSPVAGRAPRVVGNG